MLIDEVDIVIRGGHGGAGKVSFFPGHYGGPDGGNGGKGGDVYIRTVSDLTALNQFSRKKIVEGKNGNPGGSNVKSGLNAEDIEIIMPVGVTMTNKETGEEINLTEVDQRILIAKGGLGGKGNTEFKSSLRTTPKFAQPGLAGEEFFFKVNLKLIADFGLIGLPNAGKSSLLNELTKANVKTANYPFTTLEPNLGVMNTKILADIPGLIEGASEGKGLGTRFLKHIEKVNLLLHCITAESENSIEDYKVVKSEMEKFNPEILKKKEIILLTKTDLVNKKELSEKLKTLKKLKKEILPVSIHDWDSLEALKEYLKTV
ncbi:MAG: GTPase ObgE [Microgenomates group bacterium]|jgi:GTP-binding protein